MAFLCAAAASAPAAAQAPPPPPGLLDPPALSLRPFFVAAEERFTASESFKTIFGQPFQPFWGGGLSVAFRNGFYFDVTASQFKKTGERAFLFEGDRFPLGIPLTVTLTPLEVTVGARSQVSPRVHPYFGVGVGSYRYQESSQFDDGAFDSRHLGYLIVVGAEFRASRWVGLSGDAQYTHVTGILGAGGVSQEASENNLGGIAGRFRIIVGR
jgi:hypothetical protein